MLLASRSRPHNAARLLSARKCGAADWPVGYCLEAVSWSSNFAT